MADDIKLVVDSSDLQRAVDFLDKMGIQTAKLSTKTQTLQQKFNKYTSEVDRLSRKFKPLYSTSKLYEKTLKDLNKAQQLGVITDKQRSVSIEELNKDFQRGTGIFSTHANMMNKGMNKLGVATQQAGYQVGDFLVQVQSGTNPMVAFSQQMTQMVGVLYLLPPATLNAKIGFMGLKLSMSFLIAGLGIAIPLLGALGAAFLRSGKEAKESSDEVKTFADAIDNINKKTDELNQKRLSLVTEFDPDAYKARLKQQGLIDKIVELEIRATGEKKSQAELTLNLVGLFKKQLSDETKLLALALNRKKNAQERLDAVEKEKEVQEKLLDLQRATAVLAIKNTQLAKEQAAAQKARVKDIQTAIDAENKSLQDKILLAKEEVIYGKDSAHYQDLVAKLERDKYEAQLESNGILGKNKTKVLAVYDNLQLQLGALKLVNDQEEARLNLLSLQQRLMPTGLASGRGGDPRQQGTRYQQEFGYKTVDELIAEYNAKNKTNKATKKAIDLTRELTDAQKQQVAVADSVSGAFGDFFMGLVDGTTSAKDAFRSMAADIIQQLYRILVVEKMVKSIAGAITGAFNPASAAGTEGTVAPPRRPTGVFDIFDGGGYTGSGPRSGGLDGKGGFMAMLHPRETVVDHTKGQSTGGTVVNQTFNISANTSDDTKRLITQTIAQASPAIINQSVGAVMNQRRRGGAMKSAFG